MTFRGALLLSLPLLCLFGARRGLATHETLSQVQTFQRHSQLDREQTNRTGKIFFDEIFGIDFTSPNELEIQKIRNCTCECGLMNHENRIVGGTQAEAHKYPWVARLVYDGKFHCGASLLTNDYVITAAHCVRRLSRSKIRIVLGDHDQFVTTDSRAVQRKISLIIRHRNFDIDTYNHDIALMKLRRPVAFSKIIRPVCLPKPSSDPAGRSGIIVGWGRTSEGGSLPGILNEAQVPIYSLDQCRKMKYRASRISKYMICAGQKSKDSCQGDSGGPLLVQEGDKLELAGLTSFGVGCARPGYPGVYTRVAKYLNWIRKNTEDTCFCSQ